MLQSDGHSPACRPAPDPARRLDFDVVIATRNRPQALALSIPLILGQSRPPEKLIVIDSSDDHAAVAGIVAETVARAVAESGWKAASSSSIPSRDCRASAIAASPMSRPRW